jgi:hypothetical protein
MIGEVGNGLNTVGMNAPAVAVLPLKKKGTSQALSLSYCPNHPVNHTPKVRCCHLGLENRAVIVIENVSA